MHGRSSNCKSRDSFRDFNRDRNPRIRSKGSLADFSAAKSDHSSGPLLAGSSRANQRKNKTTRTAGIAGPHHALIPRAEIEVGPSHRITSMIVVAHATALIKLRLENRKGEMPA